MLPGNELSSLRMVRVGPLDGDLRWDLGYDWMVEPILAAFEGGIGSVDLVDYEAPSFDRIEAALLTKALELEVGGHILGITGADLCGAEEGDRSGFMFGGKDHRNDVAVVSARRLGPGPRDLLEQRLCKVALHELGHNFGLVHHYALVVARDGGCCPMSKGEYNGFGEVGYLRAVIDQRGFSFCDGCRDFVRRRGSLAADAAAAADRLPA
ncbi:MAG TPA: hypothetical protein VMV46_13235 [Thermoanaerobaculia bacterium]|nr:hypothetical protein [Thermoanaerobaculia bacterium]